MLAFHVVWIYRDNRDKKHPILYSIGMETLNILLAVTALVIIFALGIGVYNVTGISPFYTILIGATLGVAWLFHRSVTVFRSKGT